MPTSNRWTQIPKSATQYRAFAGVPDQGNTNYQFCVRFPSGTASTPDASCNASASGYELFRYAPTGDPTTPYIWQGPLTGPIQREPGGIYVTAAFYSAIQGLQFDGDFHGGITDNTNPANALTQTVFVHQSYCYDGGPEFGFYRRLSVPGSQSEMSTMYFYYATHANCSGFASAPLNSIDGQVSYQTSCLLRGTTQQYDSQQTGQVAIPIPSEPNSQGRFDYRYLVYSISVDTLRVEVRDPFNHSVLWTTDHQVAPFFLADAGHIFNGAFWGFVTFGIQKALARDINYLPLGDMTPDPTNYPFSGARSIALALKPA